MTVMMNIEIASAKLNLPADLPIGAYLLELRAKQNGATDDDTRALLAIWLTRHSVLAKSGNSALAVFVSALDGKPSADARIEVLDDKLAVIATSISDAIGRVTIAMTDTRRAHAVLARIDSDRPDQRDLKLTGVGHPWLSMHNSWYWDDEDRLKPRRFTAVVHTERPIYQPGQTIFFKGYLRRDDDAVLNLPEPGTTVTVRIRDGRDNVLRTQTLTTNDFGAFDGSFAIADGAALGKWSIEAAHRGEEGHGGSKHRFQVQDYRKPNIRVDMTLAQTDVLRGESISVTVDAAYLLGRPVVSASVSLKLHELQPPWCLDTTWSFGDCDEDYAWTQREAPNFVTASPRTGRDGRARFSFVAPETASQNYRWWDDPERPRLLAIEATVDDGSAQPVSTFIIARVFASAESLRFAEGWDEWRHSINKPIISRVRVLDRAGKPVANRAVTFNVEAWRFGQYSADDTTHEQVTLDTDRAGWVTHTITIPATGSYRLRAQAVDDLGNTYTTIRSLWVDGNDKAWTNFDWSGLTVTADRAMARPGERVRFMVQSKVSGPALLSVERGDVRRSMAVQLRAPMTQLEVPIELSDAPNVYIRVNQWQPARYTPDAADDAYLVVAHRDAVMRWGSAEVQVSPAAHALTVTMTAEQTVLRPRETARFEIRVVDTAGQPVEAELALALVDESIFLLGGDNGKPLLERLYARRSHDVLDNDSTAPLRYLQDLGGGGGGETQSQLRSAFPDTALWLPSVRTDADGRARVEVRLPDSLTTWRLTTLAVVGGSQAGQGHSKSKPNSRWRCARSCRRIWWPATRSCCPCSRTTRPTSIARSRSCSRLTMRG